MSDRLVWLPMDPAELGELPHGLRYEQVPDDLEPGALPESADEVSFYVLPYRFRPADGEALADLPRLEVVQTLSAGVEHIRSYVPEGVALCNGRGIHDASTAEMTLALALAAQRGIPEFVRAQEREQWAPERRSSLADRKVLIVGYGQIGAAIEARLVPFEVEVTRVARTARDGVHPIEALPDLLPEAEIVILIVPGTPQTQGLFDGDLLARMQDGALLVNMARGSVVDTDALVTELSAGRLRAALDVTDPEPLPAGHPLWKTPNTLIAPHVGGNSTAMRPRSLRLVREQLQRYAAREPLANVVTGAY